MRNDDLITNVRKLLRAAMDARFSAEPRDYKVRTQAYADGYMRALSDAQKLDSSSLLRVVGEERGRDCRADHNA